MSDTTNVTPIDPDQNWGAAPDDPDWLKEADKLGKDLETPMALDTSVADLENAQALMEMQRGDTVTYGDPATLVRAMEARPKARTLSRAEREEQEAQARRKTAELERERIAEERETEAERKRFTEIDPQRKIAFGVALVVGIIIFLTSALFSFPAVAATAELMLPVWFWLALVVPGFVEAFIIYFGIETVIWQARAANTVRYSPAQQDVAQSMSNGALSWMLVFTGVAVIANGAHTFMGYEALGQLGTWQAWLGIGLAALAPLSVVLITKRVSRLVFIYAVRG